MIFTLPGLVALPRPGRALELPFDIARARFNARAELFEYPPPAMIDPRCHLSCPPGFIEADPAVRVGVMLAR